MPTERLPALLCDGSFYGTLAAVRSLGRAAVKVIVADPSPASLAGWSRYASWRRCPPVESGDRFVDWLLAFGAREGRHVLYPTSDEVTFLVARRREALSDRFALYQPDLDRTLGILDKKRLLGAARLAGIDTPETTFPRDLDEVERDARAFDGPVLIKPRTQLMLRHHRKGALAPPAPHAVRDAYARFVREHGYGPPVDADPELTRPMLQRYYADAAAWIYSVAGFRDRTGRVAMLGAVKVLQRPRRLGVGLCFESAPVPESLRGRVAGLLAQLGYFGVFEIEFVRAGERLLLIDMNPRFYNQMALEVARGLDLPLLAYTAACGDDAEVAARLDDAPPDGQPRAFANGIGVRVLVGAQRALGTMSAEEAARWLGWGKRDGRAVVDAVAADDDPRPFAVEAVRQAVGALRHPRAFLRMTALDR